MSVELREDKINVCRKCNNYGYYTFKITGQDSADMMFCACPVGRELKYLKFEWDVKMIEEIGGDTVLRLGIIKNSLHEPTEASRKIDILCKDIKERVERERDILKQAGR